MVRIGQGVAKTSRWALRLLVTGAGVARLLQVQGRGWSLLLVLVLVLTSSCSSDGGSLPAWSRRWLDERTHRHATALGSRIWTALGGDILSQAALALVDAVFTGLGLGIVGMPFVSPPAVMIFFAAVAPILGGVVIGVLAILVALVTHGWVQALIVLGIVLLVQQLEGDVLQPVLVGRTLALHPAVVIGSVTVDGTLFGITGGSWSCRWSPSSRSPCATSTTCWCPTTPRPPARTTRGAGGRAARTGGRRGADGGGRAAGRRAGRPRAGGRTRVT